MHPGWVKSCWACSMYTCSLERTGVATTAHNIPNGLMLGFRGFCSKSSASIILEMLKCSAQANLKGAGAGIECTGTWVAGGTTLQRHTSGDAYVSVETRLDAWPMRATASRTYVGMLVIGHLQGMRSESFEVRGYPSSRHLDAGRDRSTAYIEMYGVRFASTIPLQPQLLPSVCIPMCPVISGRGAPCTGASPSLPAPQRRR